MEFFLDFSSWRTRSNVGVHFLRWWFCGGQEMPQFKFFHWYFLKCKLRRACHVFVECELEKCLVCGNLLVVCTILSIVLFLACKTLTHDNGSFLFLHFSETFILSMCISQQSVTPSWAIKLAPGHWPLEKNMVIVGPCKEWPLEQWMLSLMLLPTLCITHCITHDHHCIHCVYAVFYVFCHFVRLVTPSCFQSSLVMHMLSKADRVPSTVPP